MINYQSQYFAGRLSIDRSLRRTPEIPSEAEACTCSSWALGTVIRLRSEFLL